MLKKFSVSTAAVWCWNNETVFGCWRFLMKILAHSGVLLESTNSLEWVQRSGLDSLAARSMRIDRHSSKLISLFNNQFSDSPRYSTILVDSLCNSKIFSRKVSAFALERTSLENRRGKTTVRTGKRRISESAAAAALTSPMRKWAKLSNWRTLMENEEKIT